MRSTDEGRNWDLLKGGLGIPLHPHGLVIDPKDNKTLYLWTNDGLERSGDGGDSWLLLRGPPQSGSPAVAIHPDDTSILYFATGVMDPDQIHGQISFYKFRYEIGDSLIINEEPLSSIPVAFTSPQGIGTSVHLDPQNPSTIYLATQYFGIHQSIDGGKSWTELLKPGSGISVDHPAGFGAWFDPHNSSNIYLSIGRSGLFKSEDGGKTLAPIQAFSVGETPSQVRGLIFDPEKPSVIYTSGRMWSGNEWQTRLGAGAMSIDGGVHWTAMDAPTLLSDGLAIGIVNGLKKIYGVWTHEPTPPGELLVGVQESNPLSPSPPTRSEVSPHHLDFGPIVVGNSATKTLNIRNTGATQLWWKLLSPVNPDFTLDVDTDTLLAIPSGGFITVNVTMTPSGFDSTRSVLRLHLSNTDYAWYDILLTGRGVNPSNLVVATTDLNFGIVYVGQDSSFDLAISNTGDAPLKLTDFNVNPSVFSLDIHDLEVAPGDTANIPIRFTPTIPNTYSGLLFFSTNVPSRELVTIILSGKAVLEPFLETTPTTINWPLTFAGQVDSQKIRISNTGEGLLHINRLESTSKDLVWKPLTLPIEIDPSESKDLHAYYRPSTAQDTTVHLIVHSDAPGNQRDSIVVRLKAHRIELSLDLNPDSGDQGQTALGELMRNRSFRAQVFAVGVPPSTGYSLTFEYDKAYLTLARFTPSDFIPIPSPATGLYQETDLGAEVAIVSLGEGSGSGDGILGTIEFRIGKNFPGSANIAISLISLNLEDTGEERIPVDAAAQVTGEPGGISADFNGDGLVDFSDFFLFANAFGKEVDRNTSIFDLNENRKIDFEDFFKFANEFGKRTSRTSDDDDDD